VTVRYEKVLLKCISIIGEALTESFYELLAEELLSLE
jgi:hypothetical protein